MNLQFTNMTFDSANIANGTFSDGSLSFYT